MLAEAFEEELGLPAPEILRKILVSIKQTTDGMAGIAPRLASLEKLAYVTVRVLAKTVQQKALFASECRNTLSAVKFFSLLVRCVRRGLNAEFGLLEEFFDFGAKDFDELVEGCCQLGPFLSIAVRWAFVHPWQFGRCPRRGFTLDWADGNAN